MPTSRTRAWVQSKSLRSMQSPSTQVTSGPAAVWFVTSTHACSTRLAPPFLVCTPQAMQLPQSWVGRTPAPGQALGPRRYSRTSRRATLQRGCGRRMRSSAHRIRPRRFHEPEKDVSEPRAGEGVGRSGHQVDIDDSRYDPVLGGRTDVVASQRSQHRWWDGASPLSVLECTNGTCGDPFGVIRRTRRPSGSHARPEVGPSVSRSSYPGCHRA